MTSFVKPDFARRPSFKGGFGANPDFLPHDVRNELLKVIKGSALDSTQQEKLVAYANELAQMPDGQTEANADQRAQITKIASDARNLLASLKILTTEATATLRTYADEAWVVSPSPLPSEMKALMREIRPAEFMAQIWDLVDALKVVAEYANEQMGPGGKPLESRQRAMVASLAARHHELAGTYPPKSEGTWFVRFVRVLGRAMGLHFESEGAKHISGKPYIGGRIPGTGIEQAAEPFFTDEEMEEIKRNKAAAAAAEFEREQLANCTHEWPRPEGFRGPQTCKLCGTKRGGPWGQPAT